MTHLNCPRCGRETEELPAKEKAPFMYNTCHVGNGLNFL